MSVKQLMTMKPTGKLRDKFSGAEFVVSEVTMILSQMVISRQYKDADEFADRFEVIEPK